MFLATRHALRLQGIRNGLQTRGALVAAGVITTGTVPRRLRTFSRASISQHPLNSLKRQQSEDEEWLAEEQEEDHQEKERLAARPEHAVISTFDLFSIGGESGCFLVFSVVRKGAVIDDG
jgi:hypothetical protein